MGASFCYLLSMTIGRRLAYRYFPDRIKSYAKLVSACLYTISLIIHQTIAYFSGEKTQ